MTNRSDSVPSRTVEEALPAFARFMGVRVTSASLDLIEADLSAGADYLNRNGVLHGGAVMAFADILGGAASVLNLPEGARTTTIESKTNFFRAIPAGQTARATCVPLHRGRTTMVWQTTITGADGRPAAIVTQTQLVLNP